MNVTSPVSLTICEPPNKHSSRRGLRHKSRFHRLSPLPAPRPETITTDDIEFYATAWLQRLEAQQQTVATLGDKRDKLKRLVWFLKSRNHAECGPAEVEALFGHMAAAHRDAGRWDNPRNTSPMRPISVKGYHRVYSTFFNWLIAQDLLAASPLDDLERPRAQTDQIEPFTLDEVSRLLAATAQTWHPRRNRAIILTLFDTGLRSTELARLKFSDLDLKNKRLTVLGKGNKYRVVPLGLDSFNALYDYLREDPRGPASFLFQIDRGANAGGAMDRASIYKAVIHAGDLAGIHRRKSGPHTFRHTFAITFLRNGGNVFALQALLGHNTLAMTRRYAAIAEMDVAGQHRQFSPGDSLRRR